MRRGAIAGVASRGVSLATGLATVPLLLNYLGATRFGIWATVTSLASLLSFADLGLSNGLVNAVADADARSDRTTMRRDVSSAVLMLSMLALGLLLVVAVISQFVGLGGLVSAPKSGQASGALVAFAVCFAIGIPLACILKIQMGLQRAQASYGWLAVGSVLGVIGNVAVVVFGGSLVLAVVATGGGPVVAAGLNAIVLFGFERPWLSPQIGLATRARMRKLLRSGGLFFVVQASFAICYQSDALVINHVLGPRAVTQYTAPMKLFYFAPVVQSFALLPFWPAVRNALAHGDVRWAKRAFVRVLVAGTGGVALLTALLLLAAPTIIHIWTAGKVMPSRGLLLALASWALTSSVITPLSYFLSGVGSLRFLAMCFAVMAPANLAMSIVGAHTLGIAGVPGATVLADVTCVILPAAIYLPQVRTKLRSGGPSGAELA
jgi:O-antigen/teichoic acid export membrane protein